MRLGRGLGSLIAKGGGERAKSVKEAPKKEKQLEVSPAATKIREVRDSLNTEKESHTIHSQPSTKADLGHNLYQEIPLDAIEVNPYQPRKDIDEEAIQALTKSIAADGLLQPIVVRKKGEKRYQIIAGERRWRACKALKLKAIAARIVEANDASSAVLSLVENLQREDLNPVDEAMGYASLMRDFDLTQDSVAQKVSKARSTVTNALRLLQLEDEILGYVRKGILSTGHAKALLGLEQKEQQLMLARKVIEAGMSVRETETRVLFIKNGQSISHLPKTVKTDVQQAVIGDLQKQMISYLSTKVQLKHGPKKGKLIIEYRGNEDLHRILQKIGFMRERASQVA